MAKVTIEEIALETGRDTKEIIQKAKELGFKVRAKNSTVSDKEAAALIDYVIYNILPENFSKDTKKETKTVQEQKESKKSPTVSEEETKVASKENSKEKEDSKKDTKVEEVKKAPKKRKGIIAKPKEQSVEKKEPLQEKKEKKEPLKRRGITIIKKKNPKPEPVVKEENQESAKVKEEKASTLPVSKKKKKKTPVSSKDSGKKIEITDRDLGGSNELYEEEEIVLLDFSDKIIFDEAQKQEARRKEESRRRAVMSGSQKNIANRVSQRVPSKRKKKKRDYKKAATVNKKVEVIKIPEDVRVYEFAEKVGRSVGEVVKVLFALGTMVTKNDFLDKDSIEILADEFDVKVETINPLDELDYVAKYDEIPDENPQERPPVVTIMGHVDHGKTSLLDKIRSTKVTATEAGGITQHVGAYQVEKDGKKITFIDTPGHSAFTQMRARGAQATDIAIIVVAADDGVMPQTKESISHAKAADVPIIIAINKIDKPTANPDNVKSQMAEIGIVPVEWGGEYEFINVSAHTGEGIDDLLETILLQAEIMELSADPNRKAKAIVIESSVEKGLGNVANIIVKNGSLKVGDNIIVGTTYGRVRSLILDDGSRAKSIGPSTPAALIGLHDVPQAGDILVAMDNAKEVAEIANKRKELARNKELSRSTKVSLDELGALIAEGKIKKLPLLVKADVQGSLEAIKKALSELKNDEVEVQIIHSGVGGITESDVILADASEHAIIVGFNVRPTGAVKNKAKELGVEIRSYNIIYDLIDDVKSLLSGLMSPVIKEEIIGQAEVRKTFVVAKVGTIAGCMVIDGKVERNAGARLIRDGVVIYTTTISSLKRFNDDVKEVGKGYDCGIMLENFNDIKEGDIIETFKSVEEQATL